MKENLSFDGIYVMQASPSLQMDSRKAKKIKIYILLKGLLCNYEFISKVSKIATQYGQMNNIV